MNQRGASDMSHAPWECSAMNGLYRPTARQQPPENPARLDESKREKESSRILARGF